MWISMITVIATAAPIKVLVPSLGYYLILRNSKFFYFIFFVIMWGEYSKKVVSPSSYALLFPK